MIGEKRAKELFSKAVNKMQSLASISSKAPLNQQIQLKAYSNIWMIKQKYTGTGSQYYVSKKVYKETLERITYLESGIIDGAYKADAVDAVKEAVEYLSLVVGYRIRDNCKNRVF